MKSRRAKRIRSLAIFFVCAFLLGWAWSELAARQHLRKPPAPTYLCFVAGDLTKPRQTEKDWIRLRFEAHTPAECKNMVEGYCHEEYEGKGLAVRTLKGYFRQLPETGPDYRFEFHGDCAAQEVVEPRQ